MKLICFIGVKGSGKSYQSKKLCDLGFKEINFADDLRDMAYDIINYIPEDYNKAKDCIVGLDKFPVIFSKILKRIFYRYYCRFL